ncbi:MAG: NAD(P)/FAD-dependent oxidoreductase [Caulobacterales bacterium]
MHIAIIGAGLAGLSCARRLQAAAFPVHVFDKSRSVGGRVSTRRVELAHGVAQFGHAPQFSTARDEALAEAVSALPPETSLPWQANRAKKDWRVAAPCMSASPKALADGLVIRVSTKVEALVRDGAGRALIGENAIALGRYDPIFLAVPAEQAALLLASIAPRQAREAAHAVTAPCWAGRFAFARSGDTPPGQPELNAHPILAWLASDCAKPGRPAALECWVAHAHQAWSRAHMDMTPAAVTPFLFDAAQSATGPLPTPVVAQAPHWRSAKGEQASGIAVARDADRRLDVCGDCRLGPRVELACSSGHECAGAFLS